MKHGSGWVIFEQHSPSGRKKLLSILSPRRSRNHVVQFMQQLYVDKFASLEDRIAFKKSSSSYAIAPMKERFSPIVHLGHNPFFIGIRAIDLRLAGDILEFTYMIAVETAEPFRPKYEERSQSIIVKANN